MSQGTLRADARRNRDRIVAAATTLFVDDGPDVPLETVARAAGVGIATLYRRFPDRHALLRAVVQDALAAVLVDIRAAIDAAPSTWEALSRALGWSPQLRVVLRLWSTAPAADHAALHDDPAMLRVRDELVGFVDDLVRAAQDEGTLRDDVAAGDVVLLMSAVSRALPSAGESARNAYDRAHALVLDALRTPTGHALPGTPVRVADLPL